MIEPTLSPGAGNDKDDSGSQQESSPPEAIEQVTQPKTDQGEIPAENTENKGKSSPGRSKKPAAEEQSAEPRVVVRYGLMNNIGEFRNKTGAFINPNTKVVVRTNRGVELGHVVCGICCSQETEDGASVAARPADRLPFPSALSPRHASMSE